MSSVAAQPIADKTENTNSVLNEDVLETEDQLLNSTIDEELGPFKELLTDYAYLYRGDVWKREFTESVKKR